MAKRHNGHLPRTPIHQHKKEQHVAWSIAIAMTVVFCVVMLLSRGAV